MKPLSFSTLNICILKRFCLYLSIIGLIPCGAFSQADRVIELRDSSIVQFEIKNYDSAIVLATLSAELAESALSSTDTLLETTSIHLGYYWVQVGGYVKAIKYLEYGLNLRSVRLGEDHPKIAILCHAIGNLYHWYGNFTKAEGYHRRAMKIRRQVYGPDHWMAVANLDNLANIAYDRGDFFEAERIALRVLAVRVNSLDPGDRELSKSYAFLGELALIRGEYSEALEYFNMSRAILEKTIGIDNQPFVDCLKRIGIAQRELGDYKRARIVLGRAIESAWKVFGGPHHRVADLVQELAQLSSDEGKIQKAIEQFREAINIRVKAHASDRSEQATCYEALSELYLSFGDNDLAVTTAKAGVEIRQRNFILNGDILPERQAMLYSTRLKLSVENFIKMAMKNYHNDDYYQSLVADMIFSTKGLVSDIMLERLLVSRAGETPKQRYLQGDLDRLRRQLSRLFVQGPGEFQVEHYRNLDSLQQLCNDVEATLLRTGHTLKMRARYQKVTSESIAEALPSGRTLVEYYRSDGGSEGSDIISGHYFAAVLTAENKPRVIDLGNSDTIDSVMNTYRLHLETLSTSGLVPDSTDLIKYRVIAKLLYNQIWLPVERFLGSDHDVYISPDGDLNLLSFAGLIKDDNTYLVESFRIHYLSAGRDLIRSLGDRPLTTGLLAIGNPDFNLSPSLTFSSLPATAGDGQGLLRAVQRSCNSLADMVVSALPGTELELEAATKAWSLWGNGKTSVFQQAEASESVFKKHAPGKHTIYLATHGYFLSDTCYKIDSRYSVQSNVGRTKVNSLLLSGLCLAGANLFDEEVPGGRTEDGILTAYEVAGLDLLGTELVILSACNTGLGQVSHGEGVYGLRRAFQVAGVRTVISSLWSISDKTTAQMMSNILVSSERSITGSLVDAQLNMLQKLRRDGKIDHPVSWAAFIAMGE